MSNIPILKCGRMLLHGKKMDRLKENTGTSDVRREN